MVERNTIGKHTEKLASDNPEKLYQISVVDKKEVLPLPELTAEQKLLLKGAVIENNTNITKAAGHSHELPEYTLILKKTMVGDKKNNFNPNAEEFKKTEASIAAINKVLGIKLEHDPKNALHLGGVIAENQENKIAFSLSKEDAEKLYSYGLPMITYDESSKNMNVSHNKKPFNHSAGKPMGTIRKEAIEKASSLGLGIK